VVHGDGLDELTTAGVSKVAALAQGRIETFDLAPGEAGLPVARREDLAGGDPEENARLMRALLRGAGGPLRDIVLLNGGAALVVAGRAEGLAEGVELAARSLDSGAAERVLDALVQRSNMPSDGIEAR
jgi:anthranilate phosphoribosyltransferase